LRTDDGSLLYSVKDKIAYLTPKREIDVIKQIFDGLTVIPADERDLIMKHVKGTKLIQADRTKTFMPIHKKDALYIYAEFKNNKKKITHAGVRLNKRLLR